MEQPVMSYDLIYQVYQRERQSALLSKVEKDFYEQVAKLIKDLKDEYEVENKNNPTSTKTMVLHDEIKKIRTLIREIYEYRIRKITLLSLTAAHEGSVDTKHMVGRETTIFGQLSGILSRNHEEILLVEQGTFTIAMAEDPDGKEKVAVEVQKEKEKEADVGTVRAKAEVKERAEAAVDEKDLEAKRQRPKGGRGKKKLVAVQILEDLPKFMGEGGEVYILRKKDYASLPPAMAERLAKEGKARIMPS